MINSSTSVGHCFPPTSKTEHFFLFMISLFVLIFVGCLINIFGSFFFLFFFTKLYLKHSGILHHYNLKLKIVQLFPHFHRTLSEKDQIESAVANCFPTKSSSWPDVFLPKQSQSFSKAFKMTTQHNATQYNTHKRIFGA